MVRRPRRHNNGAIRVGSESLLDCRPAWDVHDLFPFGEIDAIRGSLNPLALPEIGETALNAAHDPKQQRGGVQAARVMTSYKLRQ